MKAVLLSISILFGLQVFAQDPQFSQIYAIPLYMGPSFAGSTGGTRIGLNFRDQWPAVDKEFISYSISADHYFNGTSNGIGMILYQDHSGMGNLTTSNISVQYAYAFNLDKKFSIRPGIQFSFVNRRIDYSKIIFGDQLSLQAVKPASIEPQLNTSINYLDFSASLLANHPEFWFGLTFNHLSQPNESLLGAKAQVPIKMNVFGGKKFVIKHRSLRNQKKNVYAMIQFKSQEQYFQALIGCFWENNDFITGLWYRGVPVQKTYGSYRNNDAFIFLVGYQFREFSVGYSYDFTTSRLVSNSAGSHEISLIWKRLKPHKSSKKKWDVISCPTM